MRVAFRTEGNHKLGMGDVFGSIAIAEQFCKDELLFVISGGPAADVLRERGYRFQIADSLPSELRVLKAVDPDVLVINKLNNNPEYISALKRNLRALLVTIDDSGEGAALADLKINVLYPIENSISDVKYVSLRKEFCAAHHSPAMIREEVAEVLITQGGSDTYGFTPLIVRGLQNVAVECHFTIVAGPAFQHHRELEAALDETAINANVVHSPQNMYELMQRADMAISAGGMTMFELCCLGVPCLIVCAERFESATADRLERLGAVRNLGFGEDLKPSNIRAAFDSLVADPVRRRNLSRTGHSLIDGQGSMRIAEILRSRGGRPQEGVQ